MHPAGRNNPCGAKEQDKVADLDERRWYVEKTAENGWSCNVLVHQIESGLYQRQVLANKVSNFERRLPSVEDIQKRIRKKYVNAGIMILYLTKVKFTEKGDSNDAADNCIG